MLCLRICYRGRDGPEKHQSNDQSEQNQQDNSGSIHPKQKHSKKCIQNTAGEESKSEEQNLSEETGEKTA
jgi:hypothetical protein